MTSSDADATAGGATGAHAVDLPLVPEHSQSSDRSDDSGLTADLDGNADQEDSTHLERTAFHEDSHDFEGSNDFDQPAEADFWGGERDEQVEHADPPPEVQSYQRFDCTRGDASQLFAAADAARKAIERGQCIVLPTDTVYGIGADAFSPEAVQRLLHAKSRGRDMPPPVLIADAKLVRVLAVDVPRSAQDLIDRHWPGALTIICQAQPSLRLDLGDAEGTIALRVPDHALAREILRQTGPMAVSSANVSGEPAATTCDEAIRQLGEGAAVYLDAGSLGGSERLPSTIVDFSQNEKGGVLRHGALSIEVLRDTCPDLEDYVGPPQPKAHPTGPADLADSTQFADPADPAHPADPTGPARPVDPDDPARHSAPADPIDPVDPDERDQPARPTEA